MNISAPSPVVGIIAEYNPFHNGHAYHIQKAKELSGAEYCIVVMSGDFVQRGEPAVFDKHSRAHMALMSGADLVLELPPYFAVSSAEDFAACGVAMLDRLGVVTHLCFGSESGDIQALLQLAQLLHREPPLLSAGLKDYIRQGCTYPEAREKAVLDYIGPKTGIAADLLSSPNNILGIEYCKAILRRDSLMVPLTVTRQGHDYHDTAIDLEFASATAIREHIKERSTAFRSDDDALLSQIPAAVRDLFTHCRPITSNDFSLLLSYRLLTLQDQNIPFSRYLDVSEDLSDRIRNRILDFASFDAKAAQLKTRQFTYTRISRCLIHLLLSMTEENYRMRKEQDYLSYARVLGFRRESAQLLSRIKHNSSLPLITKTADASKRLEDAALQQFREDVACSHIYQAVYAQKYGQTPRNEFTQPPVIV